MVDGARLEGVCTEMYLGFESRSFRYGPDALHEAFNEPRQIRKEAAAVELFR